jgi:hypothetical protein
MKNLRQLCVTFVLTVTLSLPAFAGQMDTTFASPPAPSTEGQMDTTVAGQMGTGSSEAVDPVMQMALNLVQSVLSLF